MEPFDQKNQTELDMLCLALEDSDHGLFLFRAEATDQAKIVSELHHRVIKQKVSVMNASDITLDGNDLPITFFKNWVKEAEDTKVFILYNLQVLPKGEDDVSFFHAFNFLRDELIDLKRIFLFGMSPYFATELSQYAPDIYSFFGYQAQFVSQTHMEKDKEFASMGYSGDVRLACERFIEVFHIIEKNGIEAYDNSEVSLKVLINCLKQWNEIHGYLSSEYVKFVHQIARKTEDILQHLEMSKAQRYHSFSILAKTYHELNYNEKALSYLNICLDIIGENHPDTATIYGNIAMVYEDLGDYAKALEYFMKALVIRESVLGKEHPDTAAAYNNIAGVYRHQGDYAKALEYYEKDLAICESVLGKEHPDTATAYNNIAGIYEDQGDYAKSLEYYKKALAISESVLGKEHPDTSITYNNIAGVYRHQGDFAKALAYYEKDLAICESVLGKEHSDTATTYNNIASVYEDQGKYAKALKYYQKALSIAEQKLGKKHPNTITIRLNLAILRSKLGD